MTDKTIYRIIDAFREGKKVTHIRTVHDLGHYKPDLTNLVSLLVAITRTTGKWKWFIDGVEVSNG